MDWTGGAAEYEVTIHRDPKFNASKSELRLAFDYDGDAARVLFKGRLLTDNWYSGYRGDGQCEVGLTYLSGASECGPALLEDGAKLKVLVLPLKRETLGTLVWLQPEFFPSFGKGNVTQGLTGVRPLAFEYTELYFH